MRLLLDENISWRLVAYLRPHVAAVLHVRDLGLDSSPDTSIWRYARQHGYDILTKDDDFLRLVLAEGFPPNAYLKAARSVFQVGIVVNLCGQSASE